MPKGAWILLRWPELDVNSVKRKSADERAPTKNIKKPKKADETLEKERVELLSEVKKRDNHNTISEKMVKSFSYCRQDVVQSPPVSDLKDRWPALFQPTQIEETFRRITTIQLESTFMEKLDCYMPRLLSLFKKKGGAAGVKLQGIQEMLYGSNTVEKRTETMIHGLIIYFGENVEDLIKEYQDANIQEDLTQHVLKIFVVNKGATNDDNPVDVGIAIEGAKVLFGISSVAQACTFLMGLIYALNLSYPKELKYTFEVFQKVFLELNVEKTTSKVQSLRRNLLA
ncbi:hypothetical protein AOXY_G10875 [Acipenser oxyrinchus oxyrinchus]|uniref:Uncharacterized protein n=1 Tax=Acipenser oxyrinchus oxyrinchus TaxID=40147 RepID=A0AAD8DEY5_ACIOX|nr:hypothetical protein AOXY_G10875 [Acipenser oxyrinchus oxyrinchus]